MGEDATETSVNVTEQTRSLLKDFKKRRMYTYNEAILQLIYNGWVEKLKSGVVKSELDDVSELADKSQVGYECNDCGNRVLVVDTDGRECEECGGFVWNEVVCGWQDIREDESDLDGFIG